MIKIGVFYVIIEDFILGFIVCVHKKFFSLFIFFDLKKNEKQNNTNFKKYVINNMNYD